jgi:hypothetical protein
VFLLPGREFDAWRAGELSRLWEMQAAVRDLKETVKRAEVQHAVATLDLAVGVRWVMARTQRQPTGWLKENVVVTRDTSGPWEPIETRQLPLDTDGQHGCAFGALAANAFKTFHTEWELDGTDGAAFRERVLGLVVAAGNAVPGWATEIPLEWWGCVTRSSTPEMFVTDVDWDKLVRGEMAWPVNFFPPVTLDISEWGPVNLTGVVDVWLR